MKNFKNRVDSRTWGVLGKQETFYAPTQFLGEKVPLNANPLDSWDYKKSKYKRIDLVPRTMENDAQQAGVVPQGTPVTPTPTPTPSATPVTPTPTPTPTITPSETSGICSLYLLGAGGLGSNFTWINCDGTPGSTYLPNSDTTQVCGKDNTFTYDGAGSALNIGSCP